jgi:hypothetical protein
MLVFGYILKFHFNDDLIAWKKVNLENKNWLQKRCKKKKSWCTFISFLEAIILYKSFSLKKTESILSSPIVHYFDLDQGSQTCGPHMAHKIHLCDPRTSHNYKLWSKFSLFWKLFLCKLRPAKVFFSIKLHPMEHFSLEYGPPINLNLRPLNLD